MNEQRSIPAGFHSIDYESHDWDPRWTHASRRAIRRHTGPYEAAIPAAISGLDPIPLFEAADLADAEEATRELIRFDEHLDTKWAPGPDELAPMQSILLRTESASSSQIENLTVGARRLALAELGETASANARLVYANVRTMQTALRLSNEISTESILEMHRRLLEGEDPEAGKIRTRQVWIGGSATGPHGASFVPPHHRRVPAALADLIAFCGRSDLPPLIQIAISHAQFETIHPFTDGNGRTGRALVQAMLAGSGITKRATIPISTGLLADTDRYFAALTRFREGDPVPILAEFSRASHHAAAAGRSLIDDLDSIRREIASRIRARTDAAVWRLNDLLIGQPVVNTSFVADRLGISKVSAQTSIDKLVEVGALVESTNRVRHRVWQANDILARLDDFAAGIRRDGAGKL